MKKQGFSLAELMIFMLFVSLVLAASAPMITKKIQQIQPRNTHGMYICYKDANNKTHQAIYNTRNLVSHDPVAQCSFTPPERANLFKVELIGGGTGGYTFGTYNRDYEDFGNVIYDPGESDLTNRTRFNANSFGQLYPTDDIIYELYKNHVVSVSAASGRGGQSGKLSVVYYPINAYCELDDDETDRLAKYIDPYQHARTTEKDSNGNSIVHCNFKRAVAQVACGIGDGIEGGVSYRKDKLRNQFHVIVNGEQHTFPVNITTTGKKTIQQRQRNRDSLVNNLINDFHREKGFWNNTLTLLPDVSERYMSYICYKSLLYSDMTLYNKMNTFEQNLYNYENSNFLKGSGYWLGDNIDRYIGFIGQPQYSSAEMLDNATTSKLIEGFEAKTLDLASNPGEGNSFLVYSSTPPFNSTSTDSKNVLRNFLTKTLQYGTSTGERNFTAKASPTPGADATKNVEGIFIKFLSFNGTLEKPTAETPPEIPTGGKEFSNVITNPKDKFTQVFYYEGTNPRSLVNNNAYGKPCTNPGALKIGDVLVRFNRNILGGTPSFAYLEQENGKNGIFPIEIDDGSNSIPLPLYKICESLNASGNPTDVCNNVRIENSGITGVSYNTTRVSAGFDVTRMNAGNSGNAGKSVRFNLTTIPQNCTFNIGNGGRSIDKNDNNQDISNIENTLRTSMTCVVDDIERTYTAEGGRYNPSMNSNPFVSDPLGELNDGSPNEYSHSGETLASSSSPYIRNIFTSYNYPNNFIPGAGGDAATIKSTHTNIVGRVVYSNNDITLETDYQSDSPQDDDPFTLIPAGNGRGGAVIITW